MSNEEQPVWDIRLDHIRIITDNLAEGKGGKYVAAEGAVVIDERDSHTGKGIFADGRLTINAAHVRVLLEDYGPAIDIWNEHVADDDEPEEVVAEEVKP